MMHVESSRNDPLRRTWYESTAQPAPARPALAGEHDADAVVVGAGLAGLSAALELAERGFSVVLLEAGRIAGEASGRNGGQIVSGYIPDMRSIAAMHGKPAARRLWDMAEEAKALLRHRVTRHAIDCDLKDGYLFAALNQRQLAELEGIAQDWQSNYGYDRLRMLDRPEIAGHVASSRYVGGLYDSGGGHLHPLNYALGLAGAAEQAGARINENSPVLRWQGGKHPFVETPQGRVRARHLLFCTAFHTTRLVPKLSGANLPLTSYMVASQPLPNHGRDLLPGGDAVCDMSWFLDYFRLTRDGRLLFGGDARYGGEAMDARAILRPRIERVFPGLKGLELEFGWSGQIDISRRRLPALGRIEPTVWYANGFSGQGVALTGLAGKLLAEAAAGTEERFDVFARLPQPRFPGGRLRGALLRLALVWFRLRDRL